MVELQVGEDTISARGGLDSSLVAGGRSGGTRLAESDSESKVNLSGDQEASEGRGGEFQESGPHVRRFEKGDDAQVREICVNHFRSLILPIVKSWISQYGPDYIIFNIFLLFFVPYHSMLRSNIIFLTYLIIRARMEIGSYIREGCPDLSDIESTYLRSERSSFWVADIASPEAPYRRLVGCIAIAPYKEDSSVGHVVRLVVDHESRRMKIGSKLLTVAEEFAKKVEFKEIRIFTNNLNPDMLRFFRSSGYELVCTIRRGLMRGDLLIWKKSFVRRSTNELMIFHTDQILD